MKKILLSVLFSLPLICHAAPGDIKPGVGKAALQALRNAAGPSRSLPSLMEMSVRSSLLSKGAEGEAQVAGQIAALKAAIDGRRTLFAANPQTWEQLRDVALFSSYASQFSDTLTQSQFADLMLNDVFGTEAAHEYFSYPSYKAGIRPFVTTKQPFYVQTENSKNENFELFIPEGSEVQVLGKLFPDEGEMDIRYWLNHLYERMQRRGKEYPALRQKAKQPHLTKTMYLTEKDLEELVFSSQADQLFTTVFLVNDRDTVTPAMFTRVPLAVGTLYQRHYPAGSLVYLVNSAKYYAQRTIPNWAVRMNELLYLVNAINHDKTVSLEWFDKERSPKGDVVYRPKTFMLWDGNPTLYIIGPQDVLSLRTYSDGEQHWELLTDAVTAKAFREDAQTALPDAQKLLAKLPENKDIQSQVYDASKITPVKTGDTQVMDHSFDALDILQAFFGRNAELRNRIKQGQDITIDDLRRWSQPKETRTFSPQRRVPEEEPKITSSKHDGAGKKSAHRGNSPYVVHVQKVETPQSQPTVSIPTEEEIATLKSSEKINPVPERYNFKHFNPRFHKGNNKYIMYQVVEEVTLSNGKTAHPGDYIDVTGGRISVRSAEDVQRMFTPISKGKNKNRIQ